MTRPGPPPPIRYICGMISATPSLFDAAAAEIEPRLGPVEDASEVMDFDFTDYYDDQTGAPLYRRFVSLAGALSADRLADAKLAANAIEAGFAARQPSGPPRPINIDPGYVEASKLVLASMKNFSHRIYLRDGVYAEVTLQFGGGRWRALPWTFPDYASGRYDAFLTRVRERLRERAGKDARK